MFGYTRKERNSDLMSALGFAYDDKLYARLCKEQGAQALSLKQMALNVNFQKPMRKESKLWKDGHSYAHKDTAVASHFFTATAKAGYTFTGSGRAHDFMKYQVSSVNKTFIDNINKQFCALQIIASGETAIPEDRSNITPQGKDRLLKLEIATTLQEIYDKKDDKFYYEPVRALYIQRNSKKFQIL